jgi:hypothetical protein
VKFFNAKKPLVVTIMGVIFIAFGVLVEPRLSPLHGTSSPVPRLVFGVILVIVGLLFLVQGIGTMIIKRNSQSKP